MNFIQESFSHYMERPGLSQSKLKLGLTSMAHIRYGAYKESEAKQFGSLAHLAVFKPDLLKELSVKPEGMKFNTKEGMAWKVGRQNIVSQEDYDAAIGIRDSINRHKTARKLLDQPGYNEVTLLATDPETGVELKCCVDRLSPGIKCIKDLKTTVDASPAGFAREIVKWNLHVQAAWYIDIAKLNDIDITTWAFLAVEKEPPYLVSVCQLSNAAIQRGRDIYRRLLNQYKECLDKDEWPGHEDQVHKVDLPDWAMQDKENTVEGYSL